MCLSAPIESEHKHHETNVCFLMSDYSILQIFSNILNVDKPVSLQTSEHLVYPTICYKNSENRLTIKIFCPKTILNRDFL